MPQRPILAAVGIVDPAPHEPSRCRGRLQKDTRVPGRVLAGSATASSQKSVAKRSPIL